MRMASCWGTSGCSAAVSSGVPGVPYLASGIEPSPITTSHTSGWLRGMPEAANPGAGAGSACTPPRAPFHAGGVHIHHDHVRRLHHAFAHGGRRGQNVALVEAYGKIAVHGGHVT